MPAKRIAYLDAIRGTTMLLVVFQHIRSYSIGLDVTDSSVASLFILFRMPMFFFISGFIAHKVVETWNYDFFIKRLTKKFKVQIIPTIVFFTLYSLYTQYNIYPTSFPGGYWFTIVLFEMFVIYFFYALFCHYTCHRLIDWLLIVTAIGLMFIDFPDVPITHYLALTHLRGFFRFFVLGILCRKYSNLFFKMLDCNKCRAGIILLAVALLAIKHLTEFDFGNAALLKIMELIIKTTLVITFFMVFYSYRNYWESSNKISKSMQYVGRRTLDLYMLHYFFLPHLPFMYDWFAGTGNDTLELLIIGFITIVITALSLLTSSIIRSSSILAKWLFGQNVQKTV